MIEIWKDIPEYEGLYKVSNLGNIKSLSKEILLKGKYPFISKEKNLKLRKDIQGYLKIDIRKNQKAKTFKVHQLIAMAFLNHKLDGTTKLVIDHINNNPSDNRLENLQIISNRENSSKDRKNKTSKYTGVHWSEPRNKWKSQIQLNNKVIYLGLFTSELEAYNAYKNKLNQINKNSYTPKNK